jgi:hypothetical protein
MALRGSRVSPKGGACLGRCCNKLKDAAMAAVAKGCPNLTSLDVA